MKQKAAILPLLAALISPICAQTPTPAKEAPAKPKAAEQDKDPPYVVALANLKKAGEADRDKALAAYIDAQIGTNALYAGQYDDLKKLKWDAVPTLVTWITKPPSGIKAKRDGFSNACLLAIRDCVDEPTDEIKKTLTKAAKDYLLAEQVRDSAKYALAEFGDRTEVDKMIERAQKNTKAENVRSKYNGWSKLAKVHYELKEYDDAANAHKEIIKIFQSVGQVPSNYYNCGCSLALAGKTEEAFEMVTKALEAAKKGGQNVAPLPKSLLLTDKDIESLRSDPRYAALMKKFYGVDVKVKGGDKAAPKKADAKKADTAG